MYNRDTDSRHIQSIISVPRRYGRQVKRSKTSSSINTDEAEPGFDANNELNTRANTICAGTNWRILSASGQCCDVYGFHKKINGIEYMPIARVDTLIRDEHVRVHILIVNQALYFGASLDHSLRNTNQISVYDDPYNSGRDFGINHEDQFILFKTEN